MNDFIELNSENLKKGYVWCAGFLNLIFIIFLTVFYSEIPLHWIIIVVSITLFFAPFFILSAWCFDWYRNRRNYNRIYAKEPYKNLSQIGFYNRVKTAIHPNGMLDYIYFSKINNWEIYFNVSFLRPKVVTFNLYGKIPDFKKSKSKVEKLNTERFEIERYRIYWHINTKKENNITLNLIEKKLNAMIELAENLNCEQIQTFQYEKAPNTRPYKVTC